MRNTVTHGVHTSPIRSDRALPAPSAGQRQLAESECVKHAILYVTKHGGKWRGLPKRFGYWHTIYTRMSRWPKSGVLDRVFAGLQQAHVVRIKIEAVSRDSTIVKVHPDGTGALKKRSAIHWQVPRRLDHQGSYGCRGCSNGRDV